MKLQKPQWGQGLRTGTIQPVHVAVFSTCKVGRLCADVLWAEKGFACSIAILDSNMDPYGLGRYNVAVVQPLGRVPPCSPATSDFLGGFRQFGGGGGGGGTLLGPYYKGILLFLTYMRGFRKLGGTFLGPLL